MRFVGAQRKWRTIENAEATIGAACARNTRIHDCKRDLAGVADEKRALDGERRYHFVHKAARIVAVVEMRSLDVEVHNAAVARRVTVDRDGDMRAFAVHNLQKNIC